jgi:choline kinase
MIDRAIILAAGQGSRLRPMTNDRPKAMVKIMGRPMLDWQIASLRAAGIKTIVVVRGYCKQTICRADVTLLDNPQYDQTNMIYTLACAKEHFGDGFILAYSDILYNPSLVKTLSNAENDISMIVDKGWLPYWETRFDDPLDDAETLRLDQNRLVEIGNKPQSLDQIEGQFVGLVGFRGNGVTTLLDFLDKAKTETPKGSARPFKKMYTTDLLQSLILQDVAVHGEFAQGQWLEIDSKSDYKIAQSNIEIQGEQLRVTR